MTKARDLANAGTALGAVTATELAFVDGVTSAIQTQIDAKAPSSTAVTLTDTQTLTNKTLTSPVIASVVNNTLTSTTGDMIYASAANTPARLGIGSSAQVLTVAGGIPSWATPSAGAYTSLATGSLSGTTTTISSISSSYINLYLVIHNPYVNVASPLKIIFNGLTSNYKLTRVDSFGQTSLSAGNGVTGYSISATNLPTTSSNWLYNMTFNDYSITGYKSVVGYFSRNSSGNVMWGNNESSTAVVSSIGITTDGGTATFSGGTYTLYGVK